MKTLREIIHEAIKNHADLSDFDDQAIDQEVTAILEALNNEGVFYRQHGMSIISLKTT